MCNLSPACVIDARSHASAYPDPDWDGPALGKKAVARPWANKVWIERKFWEQLNPAQQVALLAHEYAHLEGAVCEDCADRRGGQIVKAWKVNGEEGRRMFLTRLEHRSRERAARNFSEGYAGLSDGSGTDAASCAGSVDAAGLCKARVLSFHRGETPGQRRAKAHARGLDHGACECIARGDGRTVDADSGEPCRGSEEWREEHPKECAGLVPPVVCDEGGAVLPVLEGIGSEAGADSPVFAIGGEEQAADGSIQQALGSVARLSVAYPTHDDEQAQPLRWLIPDATTEFFPDDADRYAWVLGAIINQESARYGNGRNQNPPPDGYRNGDYDPKGQAVNHNSDGSVGSIDYGFCQINNAAHPDLVYQKWSDGVGKVYDPRENVRMGARVLAQARADFPNDLRAQINAYNYGAKAVREGRIPAVPNDYASSVMGTLKEWGAPATVILSNPTPNPNQRTAPGPGSPAIPSKVATEVAEREQDAADWMWVAALVGLSLLVILLLMVASKQSRGEGSGGGGSGGPPVPSPGPGVGS